MARTVNYITDDDLAALLTERDLTDCLDDDGDGEADAVNITACIEAAGDEIDGFFDLRGIATPLDVAVEKAAVQWAKYLFVAHAFQRRHMPPERSGHGAMIKTVRDLLQMIATRKMSPASLKAGTVNTTGSTGVDVPGEGNVIDVVAEEALCEPKTRRIVS